MTDGVLPAAFADERDQGTPQMRLAPREATAEFTRLYEAWFRDVSAYCAALVGDRQLAADIAQEAFTRLFARWRGVRDPRGFLFLVATNLIRDHWRKSARETQLHRMLRFGGGHVAPAVDNDVADLVQRLPARLRVTFLLHYVVDLPIEAVAEVTGLPAGTVKRRLHEARTRLRDLWTETS